jgi:hypothetical protein
MNTKDVKRLGIALIPVLICIIVYLLPISIQEKLVLKFDNLNYGSWMTYIFTHYNFLHIFGNILIFILAVIIAYFTLDEEDRIKFNWILYILLISIPLITFLLTLYFRNINLFPNQLVNHRGFSGISAGALGLLGISTSRKIYLTFNRKRSIIKFLNSCYYIFLPTLAILVFNLSWKLSAIIGGVWLFMVLSWTLPSFFIKSKTKLKPIKIESKFMIFNLIILFLGSVMLVPPILNNNGTVTNILAHLFGLVLGFWIPFLFLIIFNKR